MGSYLAQTLCDEGHEITVIEIDEELASSLDEELDVKVIKGNGSFAGVLKKANIDEADYILAMTTNDSVNMLACSIAKSLGAKYAIARIHHHTFQDCEFFNYQLQFGIDHLINPEALCATELAKSIRNPGRLAVENFARGEIEVQQIEVSSHSKFIKLPLKEIHLGPNIRIGYIERDGKIDIPTADTEILAGDNIILVGPPETLFEIKEKFNPDEPKISKRVTLFGATETGIVLARILDNSRFQVRIIEDSPRICEALAKEMPDATIIQGEGTSLKLLEEEQIGDSDYFVACTKDDEDNIMTCVQAKRLGTEHVQLVINKPDYEIVINDIQNSLGIEAAVSPRNATIRELLRYITHDNFSELATLPGGKAKIIEITIATGCPQKNRKIKEIPWPQQCIIIGLQHKFRASVPTAEDVVLAGDRLVAIIPNDQIEQLLDLLV